MTYRNLICLELITHLKSKYNKITLSALRENNTRMTYAYNVNQTFEMVINQIKTSVNFANTERVPYTPKQVATTTYVLIFSIGYFTDSCQRWNAKSSAHKMWANFKPFFAHKQQTWQETQPWSAGGVYPSTNYLNLRWTRPSHHHTSRNRNS